MVVPGGGAGVFCHCGMVHLEIAGAGAVDWVGDRGVAGGELSGEEGHAADDWMARGQFVAGDSGGGKILWREFRGDLCGGRISGDAAAHAGARAGAATIRELFGVLRTAAGGTEFAGDESIAARISGQSGNRVVAGGAAVRGAALAESGAGAGYVRGRSGDGVVIRKGTEHCAAGDRASGAGIVDLVGVSVGVASFDAGGTGVLDVRGEVRQESRVEKQDSKTV